MSSFYYLGVGVFSLAAGIDNFEIGSRGNDYKRFKHFSNSHNNNRSYLYNNSCSCTIS